MAALSEVTVEERDGDRVHDPSLQTTRNRHGDTAECGGSMLEDVSSDESIESLDDPKLKKAITEKFKGDEAINILVFGKYKVGKSTLINSLFYSVGKTYEMASEGMYDPTTDKVSCYGCEMHGVKFNLYDTPGLQDGVKVDAHYLEMIRDYCPKLHLLIYCTKINEPLRPDDKEALENVRSTFTKEFWQNLVVAMTHADQVRPAAPNISLEEHFKCTLGKKTKEMYEYFKSFNQENLDVLPTSTVMQLHLLNTKDWRVDFWIACVLAAKPGREVKQSWKSWLSGYCTMNTVIIGATVVGTVALAPVKVPLAITVAAGGGVIYCVKKAHEKKQREKETKKDKNA